MFKVTQHDDFGTAEVTFPTGDEADAYAKKVQRVGIATEIKEVPEPCSELSAPATNIEEEMVLDAITRKFADPEGYEMPNGWDVMDEGAPR
jgi:hypothetical protein